VVKFKDPMLDCTLKSPKELKKKILAPGSAPGSSDLMDLGYNLGFRTFKGSQVVLRCS
jgi:hypothetical protein